MNSLGIYVHSPYCLQKCKYCDFVSFAKSPSLEYYKDMALDIKRKAAVYSEEYEVDSIFFGGGTPSLATREMLSMVLGSIRTSFHVLEDAEISIETNPETVTKEKIEELLSIGFNRFSVGVQSLDDKVLTAIGRVHDANKAREALSIFKSFDVNYNADLMIGLPYQSLEGYFSGLDEVLLYKPKHLSFYSLQLEEGTSLYEEYKAGVINLPSWDDNRAMYHGSIDKLKEHGYIHYEVSNAALPSYECKHNLKYWNMKEYLGFGLSAHSFINGIRTENTSAGEKEIIQSESDLKGDYIFTKLRLIAGIDLDEYKSMFDEDFYTVHKASIDDLVSMGMLIKDNKHIRFTSMGLDNTNPVMERLLNE